MISSAGENMLVGIRQALYGAASPGAPGPLPYFSIPPLEAKVPEVDRFCIELEQVGGQVARVETRDEIKEYLQRLLPAGDATVVAISDSAAARDADLCPWLESRNINVVPTLPEFISSEGDAEQLSAGAATGGPPRSAKEYLRLLLQAHVGITSADYAIADTGTLVLVAGGEYHRLISLLPLVHVCLLDPRRIVPGMAELLSRVHRGFDTDDDSPTAVTLITGPSCTADIEQTLTKGMHGPHELHVLLYSAGGRVQL